MIKRTVKIKGNDIYISNGFFKREIELAHVFEFHVPMPAIRVFENKKLKREFNIDTLDSNPDLNGQFFHSSIRVLTNGAVMIDGIVSKDRTSYPDWKSKDYEAIRLQPFFLSSEEAENNKLVGAGLFQRGLHFSGTVTPLNVRAICICDNCKKSFTLQHFHAGFSEAQYFYSSDGKQTLYVSYEQIKDLPRQLQEAVHEEDLRLLENQLPKPTKGQGNYSYYNPLRCLHCCYAFIDFEQNKEIRHKEYYGNYFINQQLQKIGD
ncbi:hypothetical protein [Pontibacter silvestris]|nr:hypothetical protein [Pontibacter silvestris]MCC9138908.1 hypothetical protein [Pontibacter silvestris]